MATTKINAICSKLLYYSAGETWKLHRLDQDFSWRSKKRQDREGEGENTKYNLINNDISEMNHHSMKYEIMCPGNANATEHITKVPDNRRNCYELIWAHNPNMNIAMLRQPKYSSALLLSCWRAHSLLVLAATPIIRYCGLPRIF